MASASDRSSAVDRLESWLGKATEGLSEEAARRVREEVTDHVLSAVEEGVVGGLDEAEAVRRAVDALGAPERAGRALRRANLRPWEAKVVGGLKEPQPLWVQALYWGFVPVFVLLNASSLESPARGWLFALCLSGLFGGIAARFYIAQRLARSGKLRAALVADVFGQWGYMAALVVGTNVLLHSQERWAPVTYLVIFAFCAAFVAYLWPKLGRRKPSSSL